MGEDLVNAPANISIPALVVLTRDLKGATLAG